MKVSIVTRKPFDISERQLQMLSIKELENMLTSFSYADGSNFYFLDYYRKKIIVGSPSAMILCGFEKQVMDDDGFNFFERILSNKEWKWMNRVNAKMYYCFFSYAEEDRKHLAFVYDLAVKSLKGHRAILRHTIVPFKLCKNGNLWLGLCHVSSSPYQESGHPTIFNRRTGERYDYIDSNFVKTHQPIVTDEELMILEWMIKGLSDKEICERLNHMPITNFKRRKRILYGKLNANNAAEAIHQAHLLGIF